MNELTKLLVSAVKTMMDNSREDVEDCDGWNGYFVERIDAERVQYILERIDREEEAERDANDRRMTPVEIIHWNPNAGWG